MKLLLIDNCELEHDIFRLALERLHYDAELFKADDCKSAIEALVTNAIPIPDFIILDTDMPNDANACLQDLKLAVGLSKIILYSSSKETEKIKLLMKQGAQAHIFKSYSFTVFCQDLSKMLSDPSDGATERETESLVENS